MQEDNKSSPLVLLPLLTLSRAVKSRGLRLNRSITTTEKWRFRNDSESEMKLQPPPESVSMCVCVSYCTRLVIQSFTLYTLYYISSAIEKY